ncbi:hypothetical protein [Nocardia brasiliensis]|uniref:hypothetical protein n=1 Tax=Nocardia brasiliensis TaxID=37326 RepID=UPI002454791A|nr:hypothetical protein [Nocardia brasiliensis]
MAGSGRTITFEALDRHLAPNEVAYIVEDSDARMLFASAGIRELAGRIVPSLPRVECRYIFAERRLDIAPTRTSSRKKDRG